MGPEHDHRRAWIEQRLEFLTSVFAADDAAHSAMTDQKADAELALSHLKMEHAFLTKQEIESQRKQEFDA